VLQFRTFKGSPVGAKGVKGGVVVIHLTPRAPDVGPRSAVKVSIEFTPFGAEKRERQEHDYFVNEEPMPLTEKAFALSVFYRITRGVLPERHERKERFTREEADVLKKLQEFLKGQSGEIASELTTEITLIDNLVTNYCNDPTPPA
jgi:hypothetical protein